MTGLQWFDIIGAGIAVLLAAAGAWSAWHMRRQAYDDAERIKLDARAEGEARANEILVGAQEKAVALGEEADRREADLDARESALDARARQLESDVAAIDRQRKELERRSTVVTRNEERSREALAVALANEAQALRSLERVAGLSAEEARAELVRTIEDEARREGARIARRIEEEARERAARDAVGLVVDAAQRVTVREPVESAVTFVKLPSDEMKGRIIGREGRNIRALEYATGIDVIVDDTPQAILISSFDPVRREVARLSIDRLLEDGRIHPAKIEEVVAKVKEEFEGIVEEAGRQAAFELGIAELAPRLARLVGRMRLRYHHGRSLLAHAAEVGLLAGHMASEIGARADVARRAGLLHEIGRVDETATGPAALASADIAAKAGERDVVVHAIQAMHPDVAPKSVEALLLRVANRISDNRPGARKDNLDVFIERLTRLEKVASSFPGVRQAYAVRAGKEVRVIVDADTAGDDRAYALAKEVARALESQLDFPGEIKVNVIRETRAVQYAV
ncbi:MAG TPA: ribonuclease Y [Candidatus Polarisedimenticolaceae bacterium]